MKQQEKERVALYLRNLAFNDKEFYEEMFDHICCSFEARESKEQNVIQHIHQVIEPAFGSKEGLRKEVKTYAYDGWLKYTV